MYGELIKAVTVSSATTAITFTAIPQTFTDLAIVISGRSDQSAVETGQYLRMNGDGANNYNWRAFYGNGSSVTAATSSFGFLGNGPGGTATSSIFGNTHILIPNYAGADYKIWSSELTSENNGLAETRILAGLWNNTAAITQVSLNFNNQSSNTVQYSTAYLYGLTKGTGGATAS